MNQFEQLVFDMRSKQKKYFQTKELHDLLVSKEIEKKVDQHLDDLLNPKMDM